MVKTKITIGVMVIVALGLVSMLYIYHGLDRVAGYLGTLDTVHVPFSIATIEMEKNSGEYAQGVLRYIEQPNAELRLEVEEDRTDFVKYHASYMRVSTDAAKRTYGHHVGTEFGKLTTLGESLMVRRDKLDRRFEQIANLLEQVDVVVDGKMAEAIPAQQPARSRRLAAIANIEAEAAEIGFWLAVFEHRPEGKSGKLMLEKLDELRGAVAGYRKLPLGRQEQAFADDVSVLHDKIKAVIQGLFIGEKDVRELAKKFADIENQIDTVFDEKIQLLARHSLTQPQINANKAVGRVQHIMRYLIAIYFLVAMAIGGLLMLMIVRPLRRLARGTQAIGAGDLDYRVAERGKDEFGAVARQFNRMVEQLQASTVSRRALETSERKLRQTVTELRREIHERESSERKREKLQTELQRSEAMAATGRLVAGVAHEVRNPLFGISSTLDAIEANFDSGGVGSRYRDVLRREVNRLKRLMSDLLEYGKPPPHKFTTGKISGVIIEAVEACTTAANAADVNLVSELTDDGLLSMDYDRLLQVFVNLIDNAVRFAPEGTDVILVTRKSIDDDGEAWIECNVMDSGTGFTPEDLRFVFDPFFSRRRKGIGLGLAIVKRIVDEHQGIIEPANRAEGGAIVTVRLPLANVADRTTPELV